MRLSLKAVRPVCTAAPTAAQSTTAGDAKSERVQWPARQRRSSTGCQAASATDFALAAHWLAEQTIAEAGMILRVQIGSGVHDTAVSGQDDPDEMGLTTACFLIK